MNSKHPKYSKRSQPVRQCWAGPVAFLASLLALPASAGIKIPDDPLTTSARVAPNILFILDDSGSMAWRNMNSQDVTKITGSGNFSSTPDANGISSGTGYDSESSGNAAMYMQSYVTNSLYYNPAVAYQPWVGADGNRLTGGTDYTSAYSNGLYVTHAGAGTSGGTKNLSSKTQTFYVPRDVNNSGVSYLSNVSNYYRYQIVPGGSGIQRGVYGSIVTSNSQVVQVDGKNMDDGTLDSGAAVDNRTASVPVGASLSIVVSNTTGGNNSRNLNYWVNDSSGVEVCSGSVSRRNSRSCFVPKTTAGQYVIRVQRVSNNSTAFSLSASRYTTNSCDGVASGYDWIDCESATPTVRTVDAEKVNFATWYSYHRTRVKAAKAGAAEAFSPLDSKVRVGFRTIHGRNSFDIPVNDGNDGRFVNNVADPKVAGSRDTTSRTTWYERLFGAGANDGTPLPGALEAAGQYFSDASSSGPYGPESGKDQLSCRQNFSILTTDGYWNTSAGSVGNVDGSAGSTIKGAKGKEFTYAAVAPYMDSYSNTLADVAMKYWRTDLRTESYMGNTSSPDNNNVPTSDADPAFWQHMVTFGISIGLKTTRGWSSVDDVPANPSWPDPKAETCKSSRDCPDVAARLDDLLHAAVNGRGQFVAASSPAEFTSGLGKALAAISQRTGSFSNVSTNSTSLNTGSMVFSASYVSGVWTGQVKGQTVSRAGVSGGWTSSVPAVGSRKVFTSNGTSGTVFPTVSQQAALARTGGPADYPVTGADNASYIKGDTSNEERNGGVLRNRPNTVLGDIVGSSPTYVKETNTLYVGANDGMLHAFDAGSGEELFAYVPSMLNFNQLATLSRQDYSHKFFVDGPVVATSRTLTPNKNILIGALGRGGKGFYALDVSKPAAATASNVFAWERTETPLNNMGQVLGRPILSRVQSGVPAVVFGNGINSTGEKAVLVVLNAETGAVIREIDTGIGSVDTPNGLSAPTGVYGPDGKTLAYVYAGDMLGNVWKFDLTSSSSGSWSAKRLFTAEDAGGTAQPISAGVTVATHPLNGKRWVFFGTGRYLTVDDADSSKADSQSMYGFMDDGVTLSRSDLTARTITVTGGTASGYPVRAFEAKAGLPAGSKGWYVDLPEKGERIVQDAQVVATFLITASMIPTGAACDPDGRGYINALDAYTGTSAGGSYFDLDNDPKKDDQVGGLPVGSVDAGVGMPTLPNLMRGLTLLGGSGGGVAGLASRPPSWDRVSWREIKGD